jgi:hypothetical protein
MRCVLIVKVVSESHAFDPFTIARYISIQAGNPDDDAILKTTSTFQRRARPRRPGLMVGSAGAP